ncbi:hypothetical protein [Streptomyces himalayensis]|uniref:Uncharacterized protein n=1 Tax=Streptomyces himalayensis subsp. himalayensis TaxID=2756131 RepID=A0A7W0DUT2_9ACTN|nr:hypothetical protein [Streptomyces himalayensis]MBA2951610.1 hypothetical protein [Streptomyces himalayensis subsp. himalayensis]
MSRYLEEAAALLRRAAEINEQKNGSMPFNRMAGQERIAREFATLGAIDKGLLPAEIVQDVLRALTDRQTA